MKKTLVLIIGAALLVGAITLVLIESANKPDYHNKITGRYISTQYRTQPMNDSIRSVIAQGLIWVDSSHAGNPLYYDSLYKVEYTKYQKWQSGHKGFLFSGLIIFLVFFGIFAFRTSTGNDSLKEMGWLVPAFLIGLPLVGAFYYFSTEKEIPKKEYIKYPNGDLENWWTARLTMITLEGELTSSKIITDSSLLVRSGYPCASLGVMTKEEWDAYNAKINKK